MKVVVSAPATSANFGCGFDCAGLAYDLRNSFTFTSSADWFPAGFRGERLLLKAYCAAFDEAHEKVIPVRVSQMRRIPSSRGLGSSATAIVGGLLGANAFLGNALSKEAILSLATRLEGHPDNVAPCLLGGFVTSLCVGNDIKARRMSVSPNLRFLLLSPDFELHTARARHILPDKVPLRDAVFDLARAFFLEDALKTGNLKELKILLEDRLHVPYRKNLITDYAVFASYAERNALPFTISGSGSTLLMITTKDDASRFAQGARAEVTRAHWTVRILSSSLEGARTEETE